MRNASHRRDAENPEGHAGEGKKEFDDMNRVGYNLPELGLPARMPGWAKQIDLGYTGGYGCAVSAWAGRVG